MSEVVTTPAFVDQIETLPPLAAIVDRILTVTESPNSSASDVAKVLCEDQTVAAKILRVVNSPFYGGGREITQVSRAVVILGSVAVRNLVMGVCTRDTISSSGAQEPEHAELWRHSMAVGAACDLIARRIGFDPPEEAFLGGLLHDIGQLAMVTFQAEAFREVFQAQGTGVRFLEIERSHFGIDHTEAGSRILTKWRLPDVLCCVIRQHHDVEICEEDDHARLLAIVTLSDILAHILGLGLDVPVGASRRAASSAQFLKMSDADQLFVLDALHHRMQEIEDMFASTDEARDEPEQSSGKRVIWVLNDDTQRYSIGQLLLEHRDYEVRHVSPNDLADTLSTEDLLMIDLPEDTSAAGSLARTLADRGFRNVVILSKPVEGEILRHRDCETGVCQIPRFFTALDINWVEEQLQG